MDASKKKKGLQPRHFGREKAREVSWQGSPRSWGRSRNLHVRRGVSTLRRRGISTSHLSKKEKKDSGRHFGWPFWPMQAGLGRPPRPGGEEATAGQELWGVLLPPL